MFKLNAEVFGHLSLVLLCLFPFTTLLELFKITLHSNHNIKISPCPNVESISPNGKTPIHTKMYWGWLVGARIITLFAMLGFKLPCVGPKRT